jgi:ELWxxDGT repeat protein
VQVKALGAPVADRWMQLALAGETLLLSGYSAEHGHELWRSDGTAAGTVLLKDIWPGSTSSTPADMVTVGSRVYFAADDGAHGLEFWVSDGTAAGTRLLKDIAPGSSPSRYPNKFYEPIHAISGGVFYFGADDRTLGWELWKTDGTEAGTVLVKDINPGEEGALDALYAVGGKLYLRVYTDEKGMEPWVSDGTAAGTVPLKELVPGRDGSYPAGFRQVGGTVVFFARDEAHGMELWHTDGSAAGTALLKDVWPGTQSGLPLVDPFRSDELEILAVEEARLAFFPAADASGGLELWMTDGTREGTRRAVDLMPGHEPSEPTNLTLLGDALFFVGADATSGREPRLLALPRPPPDTTPPTVTCPAAVTTETEEAGGMRVYFLPARASDASGAAVLSYSHFSGSLFPLGTTTVTVTARDAAQNASQCTFEVTVKQKAPPQEEPPPEEPRPEPQGGCASAPGAPGTSVLWSLLALLVLRSGASGRRPSR